MEYNIINDPYYNNGKHIYNMINNCKMVSLNTNRPVRIKIWDDIFESSGAILFLVLDNLYEEKINK
jgi:hypothetical protein